MTTDQLSEVLDLVEVRGILSGGFAVREPWYSRGEMRTPFKVLAVVSGRVRLATDGPGGPAVHELEPGDVALLNHRTSLDMTGGTGDAAPREVLPDGDFPATRLEDADRAADDVVLGGRIELAPAGQALLREALPGVAHVRGADAPHLGVVVDRLFDEAVAGRLGGGFAIRQHGQLLLLEVLRAVVAQADPPAGWLRVLADERLRPAVRAMHAQPAEAWSLEALARVAGMSRTSFAERFRTVAGAPPLTYLSRWRMLLAQRALRDPEVRVGALAAELGYGSESAFSNAFKREVGESPLHYRRRVRA